MPKRIRTMADFARLEAGQLIMLFGREALYLGLRLVKTCGCCSVPNCFEFPHVARAKSKGISGAIEVIEVRSLEKPQSRKITGMSIIHTIIQSHEEYLPLKRLLIGARLIPEQARVLSAFTTKSGSVVKPVWYYETDGRIIFHDQAFVMDSSRRSTTYTDTGKFAKTIKEAYEKSSEWAKEN